MINDKMSEMSEVSSLTCDRWELGFNLAPFTSQQHFTYSNLTSMNLIKNVSYPYH